jgi:hypothetical protein
LPLTGYAADETDGRVAVYATFDGNYGRLVDVAIGVESGAHFEKTLDLSAWSLSAGKHTLQVCAIVASGSFASPVTAILEVESPIAGPPLPSPERGTSHRLKSRGRQFSLECSGGGLPLAGGIDRCRGHPCRRFYRDFSSLLQIWLEQIAGLGKGTIRDRWQPASRSLNLNKRDPSATKLFAFAH